MVETTSCISGQPADVGCTKKYEEEQCNRTDVKPWDSESDYSEGDVIRVGANRFKCRDWPSSFWCNISSYTPGPEVNGVWSNAWIADGTCNDLLTSSPARKVTNSPTIRSPTEASDLNAGGIPLGVGGITRPSQNPSTPLTVATSTSPTLAPAIRYAGGNTDSPFTNSSLPPAESNIKSPTSAPAATISPGFGGASTFESDSSTSSPLDHGSPSSHLLNTGSPNPSPNSLAGDSSSVSLPPPIKLTPLPTPQPTRATDAPVSNSPSTKPTRFVPEFNCPPGLPCVLVNGNVKAYKKREYYAAAIVWGMKSLPEDPDVWVVRDTGNKRKNEVLDDTLNGNYIDPSDGYVQEWLLTLVTQARNDKALRLHPQKTWIELLKDIATEYEIGFPVSKNLFIELVELLKERNSSFQKLVNNEIGTRNPGIHGEFLFTGITVLSEVPPPEDDYTRSEVALRDWANFTSTINSIMSPQGLPPVTAQSNLFLDSYRMSVIVQSTASSYFFSNGLILLVILLFMGNLSLTLMVMFSLILILLCFAGLILFAFQIEFGPVESLGVSIFVGLSANYLLHIAHSYHKSNIKERNVKIQRALFVTGSPILWSALSTIGGSVFLFACRTWLLTELGILICTIIALSLTFSVGFLLALLALMGPLPVPLYWNKGHNLHSCDLMLAFKSCVTKGDDEG